MSGGFPYFVQVAMRSRPQELRFGVQVLKKPGQLGITVKFAPLS